MRCAHPVLDGAKGMLDGLAVANQRLDLTFAIGALIEHTLPLLSTDATSAKNGNIWQARLNAAAQNPAERARMGLAAVMAQVNEAAAHSHR